MKLKKIISGGQTGADRAGLECARALGIETGGVAPKGWKTEKGPDPSLKEFGLVECESENFPIRTVKNVKLAEATLWFGYRHSPGYYCTKKACEDADKPFYINPTPSAMRVFAEHYEVINVAGNRLSRNKDVILLVQDAFAGLRPLFSDSPSRE